TFPEEVSERVEVFEDLGGGGEDPAGRGLPGHSEHEVNGLAEPVGERDLRRSASATGRGLVPERQHAVAPRFDLAEVPRDDLAHDPAESLRGVGLPAAKVQPLLLGQVFLLVRGWIVELVAELFGEEPPDLPAPAPAAVSRVLDAAGQVDAPLHPTPTFGQSGLTGQISQRGLRATQICRPWKISSWAAIVRRPFGTIAIRSCSILTGSVCRVKPSLRASLATCVSTTKPSSFPKALPRMTLAVLRPTPGRRTSSSIVSGTLPPCSAAIAAPARRRLRAFALKKPVERIASSSSPAGARA